MSRGSFFFGTTIWFFFLFGGSSLLGAFEMWLSLSIASKLLRPFCCRQARHDFGIGYLPFTPFRFFGDVFDIMEAWYSCALLKPPLLRNTWPRTCYGGAQVTATGLTVQAPESCNRHLKTSGVIMRATCESIAQGTILHRLNGGNYYNWSTYMGSGPYLCRF